MKKILVLILSIVTLAIGVFAQEFPEKPTTLVNDYTNTLSDIQKQHLEQKLVTFDDSTSRQIAICIIKSVGEYDIDEYAVALGRKWGVGDKEHNNGIMILVALGDRKISIQVGYGLEGAIPDMYARRVINDIIKPNFREQAYFEGLDAATDALMAMSKGEYAKVREKPNGNGNAGIGGVIVVIIMVIIVVFIASRGGGKGGGGVISSRGSGLAEALIWGALNSGSGRRSSWGSDSGSSGGGFGGFGGGSFGGGGSSGSW